MYTICKYNINPQSEFSIKMPYDSKILDIQIQYEKPRMWVLCNSENEKIKRTFVICKTGKKIKRNIENLKYIGTFQIDEGRGIMVFHLFEINKGE